ncbi:FG-GAP repeat domain-containing protein [Streptomyces sp. NPDC060194]|uniref:FG-GAP repeat domain-containing protein n=1 Tax=Streptomyces sp. NPDC060194 TaxID=3347069 RepID=UPI003655C054
MAPYDFDGDGFGDLVLTDTKATVDGRSAAGYAAVLPGSEDGPDVAGARVVTQNSLGLGKAGQGGAFGGITESADLDADGYADLVTPAGFTTVFVVWGGAEQFSGAARLSGSAPVVGDFDGNGRADLVTSGPEVNLVADVEAGEARVLRGGRGKLDPAGGARPLRSDDLILPPGIAGDGTGFGLSR